MVPRIRTVQVKNYKSLASVEVALEPFTVLVGPNGSGKSNLFDALAFVQESLAESAEAALGRRGGFNAVVNARELLMQGRRLGPDMATTNASAAEQALTESTASFGFRLVIELDPDSRADYSLELEAGVMSRLMGAFRVSRERCVVTKGSTISEFLREGDRFVKPVKLVHSLIHPEQLALLAVSSLPAFRPTFDFLTSMRVYAINPESMRVPQAPDLGGVLNRDGSNAAAVLGRLERTRAAQNRRDLVKAALARLVTGMKSVAQTSVGQKETLVFTQTVGSGMTIPMYASSVSDGTLRLLGVLLAVFQAGRHGVIALDHPELNVHPKLLAEVTRALLAGSSGRQVLLATHSPEVVRHPDVADQQIRVVSWRKGRTSIVPLSEGSRQTGTDEQTARERLLGEGKAPADLGQGPGAGDEVDLFGEPFRCGSTA